MRRAIIKLRIVAVMLIMVMTMIPVIASAAESTASGTGTRVAGKNRYDTSLAVADEMIKKEGHFENVVLASGENFPDALSGGYLADEKDGPLMLVNAANESKVMSYIQRYLDPRGTVYILGGNSAVSSSFETKLRNLGVTENFTVKRLSGNERYGTNLAVLEEASLDEYGRKTDDLIEDGLIVASGKSFADSLSASAAEKPLLLVGDTLTQAQKNWIASSGIKKFYVVGGTSAVSASVENALKAYGRVERVAGANRWETSYRVANKFNSDAEAVALASGNNFPDGLSGAPLAMDNNAPILLVSNDSYAYAKQFMAEKNIKKCITIGGTSAINNTTVNNVVTKNSTVGTGSGNTGQSAAGQGTNGALIGEEAAKSAALKHAGLTAGQVSFIRTKLDYDDGRTEYEIEFYVGNKEYDYEIDAYTSAVISFDYDVENYTPRTNSGSTNTNSGNGGSGKTNNVNNNATITLEQAKQTALNRAGVSAGNARFTEAKFEYDDGVAVYQIDFISGTREYEVEINATTGAIMEYDSESIYD